MVLLLAFMGHAALKQASNQDEIIAQLNVMRSGDTLEIAAGTYALTQGIWVSVSGTATKPVVIRGSSMGQAILDGSKLTGKTAVIGIGGSYIVVENLEVRNGPSAGISIWETQNVTIQNCHSHHHQGAGAGAWSEGFMMKGLVFRNNVIHDNVQSNSAHLPGSRWATGLGVQFGDGVVFEGNSVYHNHGEGLVQYLSRNGIVRNNRAHDNYSVEIYLDNASNTLLEGNFIYQTGTSDTYRFGVPASAIQLATEDYGIDTIPLANILVQNNIVVGSRYGLLYGDYEVNRGVQGLIVRNNTFVSAVEKIAEIQYSSMNSGIEFSNNILNGNYSQNQAKWINNSTGTIVFSPGADSLVSRYQPEASSPLCGKVVLQNAPAEDFSGKARLDMTSQGAWECMSVTTGIRINTKRNLYPYTNSRFFDLQGKVMN